MRPVLDENECRKPQCAPRRDNTWFLGEFLSLKPLCLKKVSELSVKYVSEVILVQQELKLLYGHVGMLLLDAVSIMLIFPVVWTGMLQS